MKTVEIYISSEGNDHRFIINGETIYENDRIANYVHQPFSEWKDEILQELYENCNDEFELRLFSEEKEYDYLVSKQKKFPKCTDIIWNGKKKTAQVIDEESGWAKLDDLYRKEGASFKPTKKIVMGISFSDESMKDYAMVMSSIEAAGFSRGSLSFKRPYHNFVLEEIDESDIEDYSEIVFCLGRTCNKYENVVDIPCGEEAGTEILSVILKRYIIPFLNSCNDKLFKESENKDTIDDLNDYKGLHIEIPEKIDVGGSQVIRIIGIPKVKALDILDFEVSEPGIIVYDKGKLIAKSAGEVEVRVRVKGKIEPIEKCLVKAIEHIYVKQIKLDCKEYFGTVGDEYQIHPIMEPTNAENCNNIKYQSMNPLIATVGAEGKVKVVSTGKTTIRVSVGKVEEYLTIVSELKITDIRVSEKEMKMYANQGKHVDIQVKPPCYGIDKLLVNVDNENVALYDNGIIRSKSMGEANITFKSPNSECEACIHITVINENYMNARIAFRDQNYRESLRYYEQLKIENTNDWEALLFSYLSKLSLCNSDEISDLMEDFRSQADKIFLNVCKLISDGERTEVATIVLQSIGWITQEKAKIASDMHSRTRRGAERLESRFNCALSRHSCAALAYTTANIAEYYFARVYPRLRSLIVALWKTAVEIDIQTIKYLSNGQDRSVLLSDINKASESIRQYEPGYVPPKATGSDSAFWDYVSLMI